MVALALVVALVAALAIALVVALGIALVVALVVTGNGWGCWFARTKPTNFKDRTPGFEPGTC